MPKEEGNRSDGSAKALKGKETGSLRYFWPMNLALHKSIPVLRLFSYMGTSFPLDFVNTSLGFLICTKMAGCLIGY